MMPYVKGLINEMPHHHASDAIVEYETDLTERGMGWHIDGHDRGYRGLGTPIPLLQLKIGYYLNDMTSPGQGNLCVVPASHKAVHEPPQEDLQRPDLFPGAVQICASAGTAILFHNALLALGRPIYSIRGLSIHALLCLRAPVDGGFPRTLGLFQRVLQQPSFHRTAQAVSRLSI